jgi:ATP-dependent helicase/nuclease subunit A
LLICGWETHQAQPGNWYEMVQTALQSLGAQATPFEAWPGNTLSLQTEGISPPARLTETEPAAAPLPQWAGAAPDWRPQPLPPEPALPSPLAPSRPEGADLGPVPPARSPLATAGQIGRFNRGLVMHTLLQHLPDLAAEDRLDAALGYTARPSHALTDPDAVAAEALAVLDAPDLRGLFGPSSRAEQPVSGLVGGLAILPDRILIADYKTNRAPPATPEQVPVLYLRQMSAYRAVLAALYPDRPVHCLLIWTEGPIVMKLPSALLDTQAPQPQPA